MLPEVCDGDGVCPAPYSLLPPETNVDRVKDTVAMQCGVSSQAIEDVWPCTPLQAALMAVTLKAPEAYICQYSYAVADAIDCKRLRHAWGQLKNAESILRNRIVWHHPTSSFVQVTVIHHQFETDQNDFDAPMGLGQDLCKAHFAWDRTSQRWIFNLKIHHSIFDGRSRELLLQKLAEIYFSGHCRPGPSFSRFIHHLTTRDCLHQSQSQLFWRDTLKDAAVLEFPKIRPSVQPDGNTSVCESFQIVFDLQEVVRRHHISPTTSLYAAVAIVFGQHSFQDDISFGTTLSGRDTPIDGIDDMVGPTIATVPLRLRLDQDATIHEYLMLTQERILELIPHQHHGLQDIKRQGPGARAACQFNCAVTVQPSDPNAIGSELFEKSPHQTFFDIDGFPLSLEIVLGKSRIIVNCGFDVYLISIQEVRRVVTDLEGVLQGLLNLLPSSKLSCLQNVGAPRTPIPLSQTDGCNSVHPLHGPDTSRHLQDPFLPADQTPEDHSGYLPETEVEVEMENVLREVFQIAGRLTRKDHFFQLGGDSFTAIQTAAAAKEKGYDLSVRQIYQNPYLGDLAAVATPSPKTVPMDQAVPQRGTLDTFASLRKEAAWLCDVPEDAIEALYPASPFQKSLAASSSRQGNTGKRSYVASVALEVPTTIDLVRLLRALDTIVIRNPIFRTRLIYSSEGPMQVVCKGYLPENRGSFGAASENAKENTSLAAQFGDGKPLLEYKLVPDCVRQVLRIHHALYDARTLDYFLDDLNHNYLHPGAEKHGRRPYEYFLHHLAGLNKDEDAQFWTKQLADVPAVPFPETPGPGYKPSPQASMVHHLSIETAQLRVHSLAVATVVAAAWALLLSSYCDMEDVCYGMVLAGRDQPELQDVMGPTTSTVPMRMMVTRSDATLAFLSSTQETLLKMREHQQYGLEGISELLGEGSRDALKFASLLVVQQETRDVDDAAVVTFAEDQRSMSSEYPLVITTDFSSVSGQLTLTAEYDETCLSSIQVQRMMRHLGRVVAQLSSVNGSVGQIEMVTPEDKKDISAWNPIPRPHSLCLLHELFAQAVARAPQSIAVDSCLGDSGLYSKLSYQQLDDYATVLAGHIARLRPSTRFVGVCMGKSPLAVVSMIAIMKGGRAFVPFDPSTPTARIQSMVDSLGDCKVLVTDLTNTNRFEGLDKIILSDNSPNFTCETRLDGTVQSSVLCLKKSLDSPNECAAAQMNPKRTAYVLHTSGTTGRPKGIPVSHSSSATALQGLIQGKGMGPDTRLLQLASFAFDLAVCEILSTLISGGCLCMVSDSERLAGYIASLVERLQVNFLCLTPTVASVLEPGECPQLRILELVGEPVTKQVLRRWLGVRSDLRIFNGYGPAECGFICCINTSLSVGCPDNIGRPIGCSVYIVELSERNRLAAVGALGELVICGHNVADGYIEDGSSTSEAFGMDPPWLEVSPEMPVNFYRTGDLGRYRPDGSIQILGRKDFQKKIHGQRLELSAIEDVILASDTFHSAVVELFGSSTLVAFLQTEKSYDNFAGLLPLESFDKDSIDRLDDFLRASLPLYMIPSAYIPAAHFPTNLAGKTDRRRLRSEAEGRIDQYFHGSLREKTKRPPENEKQVLMRELWAEAIPISLEQIGIDDGFFSLGGSSISVIRLHMATRKRQMHLEVNAVYQSQTLADMAAALNVLDQPINLHGPPPAFASRDSSRTEQLITLASTACRVSRSSVLNVYPCTHMQEAMMMFGEKHPGSYYVQNVIPLAQNTDLTRLKQVLEVVWRKHDILRTRIFLDENFQSLQAVLEGPPDVATLDEDVDAYLKRDQAPRYGEPLSRCVILVSAESKSLVLSQHHAIFDAWCLELLLHRIGQGYSGDPAYELGNGDFSSFIQHSQQIRNSARAGQYWQETLSDVKPTRLPQVKKPMSKTNQQYSITIQLPSTKHTSLAILVEATWSILLSRYNKTEDVVFGVIRSGRTAPVDHIDEVMGPTLTSVPLRLFPARGARIAHYLSDVERLTSEASHWEQYGLDKIKNLGESAAKACNFQSMVITQHRPVQLGERSHEGLYLGDYQQHGAWSDECLTLECQPLHDGEVLASLSYDDASLTGDDIRWISHYFGRLLPQVASRPDCLIGDLDMLGPETVRQTLLWNDYPINTCARRIEQLFHERLAEWPSRTAVVGVDATMTYKELDQSSSALADKLRAAGICRGDLVPLCLEKSVTMIIAILGLLKAGAAYVPMEIDLPLERMHYIVCEVHARMIVCTTNQADLCRQCNVPLLALNMHNLDVIHLAPDLMPASSEEQRVDRDMINKDHSSDLAYIIYTSGSSGVPKGVMMEHVALSTTILNRSAKLGYTPGLKCTLYSSYAFDSSVWEMFAALLNGSCLYIPSNEQRLASLTEYLNQKRIEMFVSTPTVVQNLLQSPDRVPSLKMLDLGGEAMTKLVVAEWSDKVRLHNGYGPSEACIDACLNDQISIDTEPNNIGYGQGTGNRLWIVEPDDHSRLSPVGCLGELLISGPALARGYLNDPERTAKAFMDCGQYAWSMEGDTRCYATGDLVRRNGDGSITFAGRKDTQIQLHGIRIEIEEIEHVLSTCDGIRSAVVDKFAQTGSGVDVLVAFLRFEDDVGQKPSSQLLLYPDERIRSILGNAASRVLGRLPKYMAPSIYLPVREIPTLTAGKVDRDALRKVYEATSREQLSMYKSHASTSRTPKTQIQKTLQRLWASVLELDSQRIGLDDDFLVLGGNSLGAIKLASLIAKEHLRLSMSDVFKFPRLEEMAAHVGIDQSDEAAEGLTDPEPFSLVSQSAVASIVEDRANIEDVLPASSVQTSFIVRALRWYSPYYIWFLFDVDHQFRPEDLEDGCNAVLQRHQILRTAFRLLGRQAFQVIQRNAKANFKVLVAYGEDTDGEYCTVLSDDCARPVMFDEVLTRFRLIVHKATGHRRFALGLSHAQYDGFCTDAIFGELHLASTGTISAPKPPSYARYIRYQAQLAQDPRTNAFWQQLLQGSSMTTIGAVSGKRDTPLTQDIERQIDNTDKRPPDITLAALVQTAWSLVLSHFSGSEQADDIISGCMMSGRDAPFAGAADVVGPCLNLVPVRMRIVPQQSCASLMKEAHEQYLAMMPYLATPVEQIWEQSPWPKSTRFGSVVLHQNLPRTSVGQGGDSTGERRWRSVGAAAYGGILLDITDVWLTTTPCQGDDHKGRMRCWVSFNEDAMDTAAANAIIDCFVDVVEKMLENPDTRVKDLMSLHRSGFDNHLPAAAAAPAPAIISCSSLAQDSDTSKALVGRLRALWISALPGGGRVCSTTQEEAEEEEDENPIDTMTNFFCLGGDSLSAAVLARSCKSSGLDLSLQDIYDFPTLGTQCGILLGYIDRVKREQPRLVFVSNEEFEG
ncbi:MAG: hypothetical protein LQ339_008634 [Xanthoria mediterranea]|nr:MAG: hypothetical protein LQ339_008634 [Xanthoria mediterranea]